MKLTRQAGICAMLITLGWQGPALAGDTLLVHGHIYTGNPRVPWASALSVSGTHIEAVGTDVVWLNNQTRFSPFTLAPDDERDLIFTLSAARLQPGTYSPSLIIRSNHGMNGPAPPETADLLPSQPRCRSLTNRAREIRAGTRA